jgi:hypothetical protein
MPSKPFVSRDRRIALGELKNLAGFVMDELDPQVGAQFIAGIALRMQSIIQGEVDLCLATDVDIEQALECAAAVEAKMLESVLARAKKDTAYADS